MGVLATDSFTEGSNTTLVSHTPDTGGGTWVLEETSGGANSATVRAANDILRVASNETSERLVYTISNSPSETKYDVEIVVKALSATGADDFFGLVARFADTSNYYAGGSMAQGATSDQRIMKVAAGTHSELASGGGNLIADDVLRFQVGGANTLEVFVNDVSKVTNGDSAHNGGISGVCWGNVGNDTDDVNTAWDLDDFQLEEFAAPAGGRIMSSIAGSGGLAGMGGIAGAGGGLAA